MFFVCFLFITFHLFFYTVLHKEHTYSKNIHQYFPEHIYLFSTKIIGHCTYIWYMCKCIVCMFKCIETGEEGDSESKRERITTRIKWIVWNMNLCVWMCVCVCVYVWIAQNLYYIFFFHIINIYDCVCIRLCVCQTVSP